MTKIPDHKIGIMVHCLATRKSWIYHNDAENAVSEVRKWHVNDRGWRDIAYAAIIDGQGRVAKGRDLNDDGNVYDDTGAGAAGFNKKWIHLALTGGHGGDANDQPEAHYSANQLASLRKEIDKIQGLAGRKLLLKGHNEVANKACPCFQVRPWYEKKPVRDLTGSKTIQGATTAVVGGAGTAATALGQLDGHAQILALLLIGAMALGLFIVFRARIKDWANGRR